MPREKSYQKLFGNCEISEDKYVLNYQFCAIGSFDGSDRKIVIGQEFGKHVCVGLFDKSKDFIKERYQGKY
jgi:hypothetical protein